jgi:hypothetical protein
MGVFGKRGESMQELRKSKDRRPAARHRSFGHLLPRAREESVHATNLMSGMRE